MSRIQAIDWRGVGLLVVLGRGEDGLVEHVLASRPSVRRVLLVDASPEAARGLPESDRLAVVTDPSGAQLGPVLHVRLRKVSWLRYLRTMQVTPASSGLSPEWQAAAVAALKAAAVASLRYYGNDPADALLGLRNIVANLDAIRKAHDFGPLRGALQGKVAVVASAGPSLDGALDHLAELQDELAIVVPDTSLKPLLARGIRPHIVTCKERTERTIPLLADVDASGIILAALPVVPSEVLEGWGGDTVALYSGGSHFPWLSAIGLPRTALRFDGSSGNMAFRVCEELGASRIVLIGQDLSFASDGRTHAGGAANAPSQAIHRAMKRIQVPGVAGRPVWSTATWLEFIQVFEVDLQKYAGVCVNTSPGGAYLRGAEHSSLDDALRDHGPAHDARRILGDRLDAPPESRDLPRGLRDSHQVILRTADLCRRGVEATAGPWGPSPNHVDVDGLLAGPLSDVQTIRGEVLRQPLFHELLTPVVQSALIQSETGIYALQRQGHDRDLLSRVAAAWGAWFRVVDQLAEATAADLPAVE